MCAAARAGDAAHPGQGVWQRSEASQVQVRAAFYVLVHSCSYVASGIH